MTLTKLKGAWNKSCQSPLLEDTEDQPDSFIGFNITQEKARAADLLCYAKDMESNVAKDLMMMIMRCG